MVDLMDVVTARGIRIVDFYDKENRHISGLTLYITHPHPQVTGEMAEKIFLSEDCLKASGYRPAVGDEVGIIWGRNNRILGVRKAKPTA